MISRIRAGSSPAFQNVCHWLRGLKIRLPWPPITTSSPNRARVHWVGPELVAEVTYLEWTDDGLCRQVVYQGLREDKLAGEVRRDRPPLR